MNILPEKVKARTTNWYVYPRTEKKTHVHYKKDTGKCQGSTTNYNSILGKAERTKTKGTLMWYQNLSLYLPKNIPGPHAYQGSTATISSISLCNAHSHSSKFWMSPLLFSHSLSELQSP